MSLSNEQLQSKIAELQLALSEQRAELTELYDYCAIIEDVLLVQQRRWLQ